MPRSPDRKPIIAGNWKMHHDHLVAIQVVQKLSYRLDKEDYEQRRGGVPAVHRPALGADAARRRPAPDRGSARRTATGRTQGAFTGEVSPPMLAKLNVQYVIVGHSERRQLFGETDEMVNQKLRAVLKHGMTPIVCVGETLEEREAGATAERVDVADARRVRGRARPPTPPTACVAYEPIWAIGTGRNATPDDANDDHRRHPRRARATCYGDTTAQAVRIQYGGSVKPGNIADLMAMPEIDGALVGGASLDPDEFATHRPVPPLTHGGGRAPGRGNPAGTVGNFRAR